MQKANVIASPNKVRAWQSLTGEWLRLLRSVQSVQGPDLQGPDFQRFARND